MMKLSVQTSPILDAQGIDRGFGMIADAGFDCVDFNIDHLLPGSQIRSHKYSGFFDQSDKEILAALKPYTDAAKAHGVGFGQAHAPFPTYIHNEPATTDYVINATIKCMMICAECECPWIVVHPGFNGYNDRLTPDEEFRLNEEIYSAFIPAIRSTGVRVATENMFSVYKGKIIEAVMSDLDFAAKFVDHMNEIAGDKLFGFCLDIGHATLLHHDQRKGINKLGDRLTVLHLHDNDGQNDQHMFPYDGITDWDAVCDGLRDVGYKGTLSFETFNGIASRDQSLTPELLALLSAIGRKFSARIEG